MSELEPGTRVGGYEIEGRLGAGGMGVVYSALEPTLRARVAIKVLSSELSRTTEGAERFVREARTAALVEHPAILPIFGFGTLTDGRPYFVMPLLNGESLRERLVREGRLPADEAWRIMRAIGEGLSAAHAAGVVHRDIKPENVFLKRRAGGEIEPILLDFGLAKWSEHASSGEVPKEIQSLTGGGAPIGTPAYMAPEQWWGLPPEPATDQYSLGVMLFELMAGSPPFAFERYPDLLNAHLHASVPSLQDRGVASWSVWDPIIKRMLEKDANDRFASIRELLASVDAPGVRSSGGPIAATSSGDENSSRGVTAAGPVTEARSFVARVDGLVGFFIASLWVVAAGYPGAFAHDVPTWIRSAGVGGGLAIVSAVAILALAMRSRWVGGLFSRAPWAIPLAVGLPVLVVVPSSVSGFDNVISHVASLPPDRGIVALHIGRHEVGAGEYLGVGAALAVCVAMTWGSLGRRLVSGRGRSWGALPLGLGLFGVALLAAVAGSSLVVTSVLVLTGTAYFTLPRQPSSTPVVSDLALSTAGGALVWAITVVRCDAWTSAAWLDSGTRRDRVASIIEAAHHRTVCLTLATLGLCVLLAITVVRARRLLSQKPGAVLATLAMSLGLAVVPTVTERAFAVERSEKNRELAEQFVFFSSLQPVLASGIGPFVSPASSPAVQVGPEAIAINGKAAARLEALESERGKAALLSALVVAIAEGSAARREDGRTVDLSLLVDRDVSWSRVLGVLRLAHEGGARRVEFLFLRGEEPPTPAEAPAEIAQLLASDFVAIPMSLRSGSAKVTAEPIGPMPTFQNVSEGWFSSHVETIDVGP